MNMENSTQNPEAIERDIRRTQADMSRTVDKIGDQLTLKNVFNSLLDKADENGVDANYLIDGARRNPVALGLIAAGAIWLVSDKNAKFPSLPSRGKKPRAGTWNELDHESDTHHRDYVAHMSSLDMRDGEDDLSYQRRRDIHRANFLMCERNPDEDDTSFRQRLNEMTDKFREKRHAWSDSASHTGSAAMERTQQFASQASGKAQDFYESNPLVGGILAAAVGAAVGSSIPVSRQEQEKLGGIGEKARDMASEEKDRLTSKAMEKKDELLDKADEKLQRGSSRQQGQSHLSRQPEPAMQTRTASSAGSTNSEDSVSSSPSDKPFIIPERKA